MGRHPLLVSREIIKLVLNHTDGSVTGIYDLATREPEIEHALRLWGNRLDEIVRRLVLAIFRARSRKKYAG